MSQKISPHTLHRLLFIHIIIILHSRRTGKLLLATSTRLYPITNHAHRKSVSHREKIFRKKMHRGIWNCSFSRIASKIVAHHGKNYCQIGSSVMHALNLNFTMNFQETFPRYKNGRPEKSINHSYPRPVKKKNYLTDPSFFLNWNTDSLCLNA